MSSRTGEPSRLLSCGTSRRCSWAWSLIRQPAEKGQRTEGEEIFAAGAKIFWFRQAVSCWASKTFTLSPHFGNILPASEGAILVHL